MNTATSNAKTEAKTEQIFTCIVCPNGCDITATIGTDGSVVQCQGQLCPRGVEYVTQELTDPRRNIATSVRVCGGEALITSVRLTDVIPKAKIFDVMTAINAQHITAPAKIGDVVIANVLGLGVDVIVTKHVAVG